MGGYVPNPVAIASAKAVAYSLFGWAVRHKSSRRGNPVGFGVVRLVAGWLVGAALVALLLRLSTPGWSDRQAYLAFLIPRFALWAVLIHYWFRPRGGITALAIWSVLGVALSTGIDLLVFHFSESVSWLRIGVC
jgi:uncharacterized membrane protein (GlpM family)